MIRNEREIGFTLCRNDAGTLTHGPVARGTRENVNVPIRCPAGSTFEGIYHTHPGGVPLPSAQDIRAALEVGARTMCIQSDHKLNCFLTPSLGKRGSR